MALMKMKMPADGSDSKPTDDLSQYEMKATWRKCMQAMARYSRSIANMVNKCNICANGVLIRRYRHAIDLWMITC